ncbi:MAG: lysylphosphatidylglycerol synthase transmembrane domain-containing protein [bacterium]|nr:lysylphosphatidylglycerol synthase transmembrane domain-containing protein [bacterium]
MIKDNLTPDKTLLKFNLKSLTLFLIFAVALYFLVPKLLAEKHVFTLLLSVKKTYILLALVAELVSYVGAATLMGVILSRLGYRISFKDRFRLGSIAAFAIHFLPISGLGEGVVDYYFLRRRKVTAGSIFLMLVLRIILTYSAFLILFIIALLVVPAYPDFSFYSRIISVVLFILIALGAYYILALYRNKQKFYKSIIKFSNLANKFLKILRQKPISQAKITEIYDDIYEGIGLFTHQRRSTLKAILGGIIYWLGDMTCLYFVFLSLGHRIHFSVLIFGYSISTLVGQISMIPGGLGVTEGAMSLVFSGIGIPISLTITAVLIFRFFSFWIWIPIGLFSYITLKRENRKLADGVDDQPTDS